MRQYFFISSILMFSVVLKANTCAEWFSKIKNFKKAECESSCRTAMVDMATYMCRMQCKSLCKQKNEPQINSENFYGLTDDELKFCESNKLIN